MRRHTPTPVAEPVDVEREERRTAAKVRLEQWVKADEAASAAIDKAFKDGWLWAYVEVLSIMQDKAVLFDIPLSELCLDELDPGPDHIRRGPGEKEHRHD